MSENSPAEDELESHRGIAVSPAGIMPPVCKPETIREVCSFVRSNEIKV